MPLSKSLKWWFTIVCCFAVAEWLVVYVIDFIALYRADHGPVPAGYVAIQALHRPGQHILYVPAPIASLFGDFMSITHATFAAMALLFIAFALAKRLE